MEERESEDFLSIISKYGLTENNFEIRENTVCPSTEAGHPSGTIIMRYKPSNVEKTYQHFRHSWLPEFEHHLESNSYKNKYEFFWKESALGRKVTLKGGA